MSGPDSEHLRLIEENRRLTARAEQAEAMVAAHAAEMFKQSVEIVRERERAEQAEREVGRLWSFMANVAAKLDVLALGNDPNRLREVASMVRDRARRRDPEQAPATTEDGR